MEVTTRTFNKRNALRYRHDVVHFHWPEGDLNDPLTLRCVIRLCIKLFFIDLMRLRGAKLFWTVHNLHSHENLHPLLERWFWRQFTARVDGYIGMSRSGLESAKDVFPTLSGTPSFLIPHGHYKDQYKNDPELKAFDILAISPSETVILFFGQIRAYKNVGTLISVFRQLKQPNIILLIAGNPRDPNLAEELRSLAGSDTRIRLKFAHISADDIQAYFKVATLVVLPFREILNSGSAIIALSFNRPILVPQIGALSDLSNLVGSDWVRTYTGELSEQELSASIDWATRNERSAEVPLQELAWPSIAKSTINAYRTVCGT